ncbi:MAG: flagellin hook IN motif-containing protein [Myxococcota bacterium]|nr:flagellin hook IN motif-containing protein [Myxococcota bacterium]
MTVIKAADWSVVRPQVSSAPRLKAVTKNTPVEPTGALRSETVLKENRDLYSPAGGHPMAGKLRAAQGVIRTYQVVTALAQGAGYTLREVQIALQQLQEKSDRALDPKVPGDSEYIQHEVSQITRNITELFSAYRFDQAAPFDGSFTQKQLALGGNRERGILGPVTPEAITLSLSHLEPDALGGGVFVISKSGVSSVLTLTQSQERGDALSINGFMISESIADDDPFSTIDRAESAIAKAAAINRQKEATGVQAIALPTLTDNQRSLDRHIRGVDAHLPTYLGSVGPVRATTLDASRQMIINGVSFNDVEVSFLDADQSLRDAINARQSETGVTASLNEDGALMLRAEDGRNIYVNYSDGAGGPTEAAIGLLGYRGVAYGGRLMLSSATPFSVEMGARVNESMGDLIGDYTFSGTHSFEESNLFSIGNYNVVSDSGRRASPIVLARAFEQVLGELDFIENLEDFLLEAPTRIYQGLIGEGVDDPRTLSELDDPLKVARSVGSFLLASQDESLVSQTQFQPKMLSALLDGSFINSQIPAGLRSLLPPESLAGASLDISARVNNLQSLAEKTPFGLFSPGSPLFQSDEDEGFSSGASLFLSNSLFLNKDEEE